MKKQVLLAVLCAPLSVLAAGFALESSDLKANKLDLDENATAALVGFMINANRIGKASFTATYGRK